MWWWEVLALECPCYYELFFSFVWWKYRCNVLANETVLIWVEWIKWLGFRFWMAIHIIGNVMCKVLASAYGRYIAVICHIPTLVSQKSPQPWFAGYSNYLSLRIDHFQQVLKKGEKKNWYLKMQPISYFCLHSFWNRIWDAGDTKTLPKFSSKCNEEMLGC